MRRSRCVTGLETHTELIYSELSTYRSEPDPAAPHDQSVTLGRAVLTSRRKPIPVDVSIVEGRRFDFLQRNHFHPVLDLEFPSVEGAFYLRFKLGDLVDEILFMSHDSGRQCCSQCFVSLGSEGFELAPENLELRLQRVGTLHRHPQVDDRVLSTLFTHLQRVLVAVSLEGWGDLHASLGRVDI